MKIFKSLIFYFLFLFSVSVFADSPLTSTDFYKAYEKHKIVQIAVESKGILNEYLLNFLANDKSELDLKLAVINALSWDSNGKNNAEVYFNYLKNMYKYSYNKKFIKKASAHQLICYAYLKAMDDYFSVDDALSFSSEAVKKSPKSYSITLIHSLIYAQKIMDKDWCEVYKATNNVRANGSLNKDISDDAIKIVFEYMDSYREYCK